MSSSLTGRLSFQASIAAVAVWRGQQLLFVGETHRSNLPLLQEAGTGVSVISEGTGYLGLLTQHDDWAQALSGTVRMTRNTQNIKPVKNTLLSMSSTSGWLSMNYTPASFSNPVLPLIALNVTCRNSGDTPSAGLPLQAPGPYSISYSPQALG